MRVSDKNQYQRRCPRLGGPVTFEYCREGSEDQIPCWRVFECWWEDFDVTEYLRENMSDENFRKLIQTKPKPKLESLVELIEKAKKNVHFQKNKKRSPEDL